MKKEDFIGAWRLYGFRLIDADGNETSPWLDGSDGQLTYTADGYMSASVATVDVAGEPAKQMSYAGPYDVHDDRVVHHCDFASQPGLIGKQQVRQTDFDGETLTLSSSPSMYGGEGTVAKLIWRRATPR